MDSSWLVGCVVMAVGACGPAVADPSGSGTDSGSSSTTNVPPDLGSGGESSSGAMEWPLCVPETLTGFHLTAGDPFATLAVTIDATCVLSDVEASTGVSIVRVSDCYDAAGAPPAMELDLEIHSEQQISLPLPLGRDVAVSLRLSRIDMSTYEIWYSLREPEGRLYLAAFAEFGTRVEPSLDGMRESDWLAPFAIELGEFVCPPDPQSCEDDDTPQRALATFSDGVSSIDIIDGTTDRLGNYVLSLAYAREPDTCEGHRVTPRLGGVLVLDQ